jgi:hypothetical protein
MNPALISLLIDGVVNSIKVIQEMREQARREKVLTEEEDKAFDLRIQTAFNQPHWQLSGQPHPAARYMSEIKEPR